MQGRKRVEPSIFPAEVLKIDLRQRGLPPYRAARLAGLGGGTVLRWLRGETEPRAQELRLVLEACGLDAQRYQVFLDSAAGAQVLFVCPECGRLRKCRRAHLSFAARQAPGRTELPRRADGTYELLCRRCAVRRRQPRAARARQDAILRQRLGPAVQYVADDPLWRRDAQRETAAALKLLREDPANRARLLAAVRRPKSQRHRLALSVSGVAARASRGADLRLCPLCELVVHKQVWHRACWYTWLRHVGRRYAGDARPAPSAQRGPKRDRHLRRNYALLVARRYGRTPLSMLPIGSSKSTVTEAVKAFIRRLPGSWDLIFSGGMNSRRGNRGRQALVRLPDELEPFTNTGQRDPLIRRLLSYGMRDAQIADLTGASVHRVQGIHRQLGREESTAPTPA